MAAKATALLVRQAASLIQQKCLGLQRGCNIPSGENFEMRAAPQRSSRQALFQKHAVSCFTCVSAAVAFNAQSCHAASAACATDSIDASGLPLYSHIVGQLYSKMAQRLTDCAICSKSGCGCMHTGACNQTPSIHLVGYLQIYRVVHFLDRLDLRYTSPRMH